MSFSFLRRTLSWHGAACSCLDKTTSPSLCGNVFKIALLTAALSNSPDLLGSANLSWSDNSDNETGFAIERATGESSFVEIARVPANTSSFEDTEIQVGALYSYRVRAFNDYGYSGYTNVSKFEAPESGFSDELLPVLPSGPDASSDPGFPSSLIGNHSKKGAHRYEEDIGLHVLSGSGKGLRGKWDSLRFAYSSAEKDSSVTLHIPAITTTSSGAEASLQFRQNLSSNSRYVAVSLDHDFNASASWRTKKGASIGKTRAAESVPASYLRISSNSNNHTFEASPDGFNWHTLTTKNCYLSTPYLVGFGIASRDNGALSHGAFEILESNVPLLNPSYSKFGPRPKFLTASDRQIAASHHFDLETLLHTLSTKGKGFEQFHDQLVFPSWKNESPIRISAQVHAFEPDSDWARFGLMLRSGSSSNNAFVAMSINGKGQFEALWRNQKGRRISTARYGNAGAAPYLAIEFDGATASLQFSRDGANWTTFHTITIAFEGNYRVGPVLGSQNGFSVGAMEIIGLY